MRLAFRGERCAYCGERGAESDDHVIARRFFPERLRGNLPVVPACKQCNKEKSPLEIWAQNVFPFGSTHPVAGEMRELAESRLKGNKRLREELRDGAQVLLVGDRTSDRLMNVATIPWDHGKAVALFEMIAKGMLWEKCRRPMPAGYGVRVYCNNSSVIQTVLTLGGWQEVELAGGGFRCRYALGGDPFISVWLFDFYGGLRPLVVDDAAGMVDSDRRYVVLTGPEDALQSAERRAA